MTPAHGNDSPTGSAHEHDRTDPPTAPIPLPRRRRSPRVRARRRLPRHPRPARPSTVWPCAQGDLRDGTGLLADWLLTAVVKIVTTYTRPGQRVLLLDPAPYLAKPSSWSLIGGRSQPWPGPYAGLHEAGWTVVRLGRGVQTLTDVSRLGAARGRSGGASAESESGLRLGPNRLTEDEAAGPFADRRCGADSAVTGTSPDRYDLVVAAAEPCTAHWFRPVDWPSLLTPSGTLAVVTQGDRSSGRLVDPAGSIVRAARQAGLRYLDRIALLRVPVRDGALAEAPAARTRPQVSPRALAQHVQVHDDLFVFTRQPAPNTAAGEVETSDE